jgi:hypothetical protein
MTKSFAMTEGSVVEKFYSDISDKVDLVGMRQDDGKYGFLFMTPDKKIVQVFGDIKIKEKIDSIAGSITLLP